ncbi:MAG: DNA polymerase, partial [Oscillospiraceae bacterium]|nr:DNA polymerase [Oscillospiraceae bacterium]
KTTGQWTLLTAVEQPLALVLADMEAAGFEVDSEGIRAFRKTLSARILELEAAVTDAVGYVFNLNSPKQLAKALFEDLHVPPKKKTKSGYSTNADVLEDLRAEWPVVDNLLEYRHVAKLKSTYCDALLEVADDHGRVHTRFNQTETRTGRISSTEPNLQNIPVRQELGRELRRYFRAADGFTLCDADYSQIELRILAAMSGDETMCAAFNNGDDIHAITASQVFDVPLTLVTPLMRSRAKAVNFGIVYGIGAHSLSEDIGVTHFEAKTYIDEYLEHYGAVDAFMQACIAGAKKDGYAVTLFGRRRPLPELRAGNASVRAFGERVARNMPIQGTAADVIKIAMNRVHARLREEGMRARLILQVHDELIVEAPEEEADRAAALLKEEMEAAVELAVKLEVDVHIGKTWYDAKG